jgi:ABC-type transport system involved in multi-copper enzyme maturation permease subunit
MLKLIIEKELKEIVSTPKFVLLFAVSSVLILLTFYAGGKNYQINLQKYEAAKTENLRQLGGLTDWTQVNTQRVFLPPDLIESLVSGVANDVGRTIEIYSAGWLIPQDSRYNDAPIFAIFRFLDLEFIFQVVMSLFAILLAFDAINGEKERGTLKLVFSNALPRSQYILGKLIGVFSGLAIPLLIPVLLGCMILILMGLHLSGEDWIRLGLVATAGLLYFGVFLAASVFVSASTYRSASAFLYLLMIWIFAVLVIPRTAVLLSARAIDIPSMDEVNTSKSRYMSQLWQEHRQKLGAFKPDDHEDEIDRGLMKFMDELHKERNRKMEAFANEIAEDRRNRQRHQERLAFALARISPAAVFSLAAADIAGTATDLKESFYDQALGYQKSFEEFIRGKTGLNPSGGMVFIVESGEEEVKEAINPNDLPPFEYEKTSLGATLPNVFPDFALLVLFNLLFFAGAYIRFLKYDLR